MPDKNTAAMGNTDELTSFFATVLPDEGNGYYALMSLPDRQHHKFKTIDEAVAKALELDNTPGVDTVYHACATYRQASYTDKEGKTRFRTQDNVQVVKAVWLDIDCGADKATKEQGYSTKNDAWVAARAFCNKFNLPMPTLVIDSGYGLHLYWAFTEALAPKSWQRIADKLDTLVKAAGLRVDPSRTRDSASVLRPLGTTNRKDPNNPKQVKGKLFGKAVDAENFDAVVTAALAKAGANVVPIRPDYLDDCAGGNLSALASSASYPLSDAKLIADKCAQIGHFRETGCDGEPTWHKCIGVVKHCGDGEQRCHEWSAKDHRYDPTETQKKIDAWTTGPTTCAKFKEVNPAGCQGCAQHCKSPIQLGAAEEKQQVGWLDKMNADYAFIRKDLAIYRISHRDFVTTEKFHVAHANETIEIAAGSGTKHVSVAHLWIRDKNRRQHEAIVTRPGEPEITTDNCLNDWIGFSVAAAAGDIRPFQQLYSYLFGDERFPLLWLAHLVQHPGVKQFVALVVWSQAEGVGKNLLFETIGSLFDRRHFALIGQSEVDDDFCGWIPGTVFVTADEVRASKSDKSRDRLKLWQTSTTLRTHDKGQPKREVENLMNMVFLSNHADGMFLSDHDRRFFVHEIKVGPLPETIKREFLSWRNKGGLSHVLQYLQQIDLTGFDPKGRAPITESKKEMIEASRSDLDRWAHDVVSGSLPVGKEVSTGEELTRRFVMEYPNLRQPPSVATVCKVLIRAGAARRDNQIRLTNGRKVRALALLRVDYWKVAPESAWREELEKTR